MKVICNATPLIHLSRIRHLWILKRLFGKLVIPMAVYNEVVIDGRGKPGADNVAKAEWIHVREVKNIGALRELCDLLHLGESEAIVLAEEIDADLIILDDNLARRSATAKGLKVVGTLALLHQAKERGLVPALRPLFDELASLGFYMGKEYDAILKNVGEI